MAFGGINAGMMVHNIYDVEIMTKTHDFACSIQVLEQESIVLLSDLEPG